MEFYFQNNFLALNPYLRKILRIFREALGIFLFFYSISLVFLVPINNLKYLGSFFILILSTLYLRQNSSKEDIREIKQSRVNLNDYLDKKTQNFLIETLTKAEILKIQDLQVLFLKEFMKNRSIQKIFERLRIKIEDFSAAVKNIDEKNKEFLPILISAFNMAKDLNYPNINLSFLFYGLRDNASYSLNEVFEKFDLKKEYVLTAILMEIYAGKIKWSLTPKVQQLSVFQSKFSKKIILNPALTSQVTNILDAYSIDLTYLAERGQAGFLIGHREELENIMNYLKQRKNIILIGDEGTGKETILMHLAWLIRHDLAPKEFLDYRLVKLDLGLIYAEHKENFLPLLVKIVEDVINSGYIILYLPYFENILLEKEVDVMQVFNEILLSKNIPIIATMSQVGYAKSSARYNLDQFFEKIEIKELTEDESIYLLTLKSLIWERQHKIKILPQSIVLAVSLAKKFIKDRFLPNSAEEIITKAINLAKKNKAKFINREVIQEIVAEETKIPVGEVTEIEKEKLLNLENLMHQRIVDQDLAIREIARVLKTYRAGLEKKKGPVGAFLFVGPTGVGKTETAKVLAKIYYGSEKNMLRLDMVEFQNQEDLEKLIGNQDGTILGRLTEPIRQNPYSLILLDEFEKTHPTILKLFLPIFDEGLIKDALGREIDFSNTLIICTSNAYSEFIKESIEKGEDFDKIKDELKSKLTTIFSVELLNRFDDVIVYKPLGHDELLKIAEIMIDDLKAELLLKQGIDLEISLKALGEIVRLGTDPIFGARPLQRKINEIIKAEIANLILANKLKRGQKIFIDFEENFKFQVN